MQMVIYTRLIHSIRVRSECDYISVQLIVTPYLPKLPFFIFLSSVVTLVYIYFIMIELRWLDR